MRKEALIAGGSDGKMLDSARRRALLEELALCASEVGLANGGLPASALLVTSFLNWVDKSTHDRARSSQGGATVAAEVRSGLLFLSAHL
eukprot:585386-Pleurochrysis_carterae.AAC.2